MERADLPGGSTWQGLVVAFQGLCVGLVSLFLGFCCVPWLHKPARALLHDPVLFHVEAGLDWVLWAQKFSRPWLTALFNWLSHTVSVGFYASFLPIVFWLGAPQLTWRLVMLMALCLYVGNAIKDLVCAPRPLQVAYGHEKLKFLGGQSEDVELNSKEYGLPSSHTMNSICLNFYIVFFLFDRGLLSAPVAGALYAVVALWVVLVAASRIYLGLHTPIDILAGAVAGLSVLICYIAVADYIDSWVLSGPRGLLCQALLSLVLLRLHPRPVAHTPSYEFTTSFMGVAFGMNAAVCRLRARYSVAPLELEAVWSHGPLWMLRRVAAGFALVLVSKDACRQALLLLLPALYRFFPLSLRRLWQPPVHDLRKGGGSSGGIGSKAAQGGSERNGSGGQDGSKGVVLDARLAELPHDAKGNPWDVVVTARFFAYAAIGWSVGELAMRFFDLAGW